MDGLKLVPFKAKAEALNARAKALHAKDAEEMRDFWTGREETQQFAVNLCLIG
jgi:hypothetical protein